VASFISRVRSHTRAAAHHSHIVDATRSGYPLPTILATLPIQDLRRLLVFHGLRGMGKATRRGAVDLLCSIYTDTI
jgi:hypothetical protein